MSLNCKKCQKEITDDQFQHVAEWTFCTPCFEELMNPPKKEEVIETLHDIRNANVDIVTIGQYLQPSKKHLPVQRFVTPDEVAEYEKIGKKLGFRHVESGALVRSSYKAHKHIL